MPTWNATSLRAMSCVNEPVEGRKWNIDVFITKARFRIFIRTVYAGERLDLDPACAPLSSSNVWCSSNFPSFSCPFLNRSAFPPVCMNYISSSLSEVQKQKSLYFTCRYERMGNGLPPMGCYSNTTVCFAAIGNVCKISPEETMRIEPHLAILQSRRTLSFSRNLSLSGNPRFRSLSLKVWFKMFVGYWLPRETSYWRRRMLLSRENCWKARITGHIEWYLPKVCLAFSINSTSTWDESFVLSCCYHFCDNSMVIFCNHLSNSQHSDKKISSLSL